jgi:hypothetical protein
MESCTLRSRIRRAASVVCRELEGQAVLVNLERGTCFTLDPVGTRIWQLLGDDCELAEIVRTLTAEFEVEERVVVRDLLDLVEELRRRELVRAGAVQAGE